MWTRTHQFSEGSGYLVAEMELGPDGSIYEAGVIFHPIDSHYWGALRYTPAGELLWAHGPYLGSPCCGASALAVDQYGNAYVAGDINATSKYSDAGELLWTRRYGDWGLAYGLREAFPYQPYGDVAVDDSGYAYVLTGEFMTIKYTPQGDTLWTRRYAGPVGDATGLILAVSAAGEVWSTGEILGAGSNRDIVTIHYSTAGDSLWAHVYDGPVSGPDRPAAQVLDGSKNLYIAGLSSAVSSRYSLCVIKYTPSGDTAWVRLYADSTSLDAKATDIALDSWGRVLVTGTFYPTSSSSRYGTIKYSPNGEVLWARTTPIQGWSGPAALAVDKTGAVYVTGTSSDTLLPATWKYSADGDLLWGHRISGSNILVDDSGNVYVSGPGFPGDYYTLAKLSQFDEDGDGIIDLHDNCLSTPNTSQTNGDFDSLGDACDNCPQVTNPDQGISIAMTGDIDESGSRTSSDIILLVNFVFKSGPAPLPCVASGDVNCSGGITSADIVALVNHVFKAGAAPCDVCLTDGPAWTCP